MKDNIVPKGRWNFDGSVSEVFSDMLSRSIPDYRTMRDLSFRVARFFVRSGSNVLDIGCSTGLSSQDIIEYCHRVGLDVSFDLVDVSKPMIAKCKEKYAKYENVEVLEKDIVTEGFGRKRYSAIISCLTLQFIPIEYRQKVMSEIYRSLMPGGVFILVEKVLGNSYAIDDFMVKEYYDIKRENSYTEEQIASKRKSLEGRLVPLTEKMNESLLATSGFRNYDTFWRYLNFCGIVAVK